MEKKLVDLIVGDKVYCERDKHITTGVVIKINVKTLVCTDEEGRTFLINKADGLRHGTRGSGQYGYLYAQHYYPLTPEIEEREKRKKEFRQALMDIKGYEFERMLLTTANLEKLHTIFSLLTSLEKKEKGHVR